MKRWWMPTLLLLAGCAGSGQPNPAEIEPAMAGLIAPSPYSLLGQREELDLTSEQVASLDSIGSWLGSVTDSLYRDLGPDARTRAPRTTDLTDEERSTLDRIRSSNQQAMAGVEHLLTSDQRERVCARQTSRRDRARDGRDDDRNPEAEARGRRGMPPGPGRGAGGWPFCASAPEETA